MNAYYETITNSLGDVAAVVDENGRLLRVVFLHEGRRPGVVQSWEKTAEALAKAGYELRQDGAKTAVAAAQLRDYFAGRRRDFDLELAPLGTEFQRRIWDALCAIPRGETRTYTDLARAAGRPRSARAAGRACATNPLPIVVPCHRAVGRDGSLTGFAGGIGMKRALLELEGSL